MKFDEIFNNRNLLRFRHSFMIENTRNNSRDAHTHKKKKDCNLNRTRFVQTYWYF